MNTGIPDNWFKESHSNLNFKKRINKEFSVANTRLS